MIIDSNSPNVIIVITDDQGYGDLGCTGNPWIHTPNIDAFYDDAVHLTDFHVSPLCTPTRGALMTGRRPVRNGAWATCWGRSILRKSELTMADIFRANGYRTAMFGKWHLGDNYPYRPHDRGFQHVVAHKGGGVGQTPDFWGNNYFDDTYFHNNSPVLHEGYCTDIWFDEALKFIEQVKHQPFFAYIATNAPHDPYLVADAYTDRYRDNPDISEPAFYGMITNIDQNFGRLRATLADLDIEDNTILIFMTDNGSSGGCRLNVDEHVSKGFNAGMRGKKGSYYDGGHRVPFFLRWPAAGYAGPHDIDEMSLHVDLLPTLIDLCSLSLESDVQFDGRSLAPLLRNDYAHFPDDRIHFVQYRQYTDPPEKWTNAVITRQWRLINGSELYDIKDDPHQTLDLAGRHPEVVDKLRAAHESWWNEIEPGLSEYCPISIGSDAENPTRLDAMDVMGDVAWHQTMIVRAARSTGSWMVDVEQPGTYLFTLRRWPEELGLPIDAAISPDEARQLIYAGKPPVCTAFSPVSATLKLFDNEHKQAVQPGDTATAFQLELQQTGITALDAWFFDLTGDRRGAYYVYIQRLNN